MVSGTNALAPSPKAACLTARVFDVFNFIVCLCVCNCVCVCVCVPVFTGVLWKLQLGERSSP